MKNNRLNIQVIETDSNQFTVIVDGLFAEKLTVDEAIGTVASALLKNIDYTIFVRSYEGWINSQSRFGVKQVEPIALLENQQVRKT